MNPDDYEFHPALHALAQPPLPEATWVSNELLLDPRLSTTAVLAGAIIASYLQSGEPFPNAQALAQIVPCHPRRLTLALLELEDSGWIRRREGVLK